MYSESELVEKLLKIEALYAGATTAGEKEAAENAMNKIQNKISKSRDQDPVIKWRMTTRSSFEKKLLVALLKRHGLRPYRYHKQKFTTARADMTKTFMDNVLWPEYQEMRKLLLQHLGDVTKKIIKMAINEDDSEEVREDCPQVNYQ